MISMTGYGRKEIERGSMRLTVEMRAVNHRFCEIIVRLPKIWTMYEERVKKRIATKVRRGRVDVTVSLEAVRDESSEVQVDWSTAQFYVTAANQLVERFGLPETLHVKDLMRMPGVLIEASVPELSDEEVEQLLDEATDAALAELYVMKSTEGNLLQLDLIRRLEYIKSTTHTLQDMAPEVREQYRNRLKNRLDEIMEDHMLDESKIFQEVALFAEKADISEEITRLLSHCEQFLEHIHSSEIIGRKLDFLLQEMNREANTIASKANHLQIQRLAVEVKTELEKMREQVQNVE
ncbi:YicC/YloC family endoribonuclease [Brevibacillus laterosporus]|uniref:YicC/YloC family endoribonuclease n=1 Tax=Brevibacillus laterosporus TaxID=1465 RepID=UPI00264BC65E|nr:YicC/YloC family endoribonuclease [Brevibacillus laterosporus]MDN9010407.1 YicC/YloC family endoribonuclease [Brevibacillus laterosporus]MDO0941294.1 YicC/YloC family endoribonuclease [Brevibacillus laterosporus]